MTGGLMQLVAYGEQDIFLTQDPQITFFKVVYRRHTNFSVEQIPQTFTHTPNFGKRVSCIVSKSGDLIGNMFLMITLPAIPQIFNTNGSIDNLTKFAWIRKIGFGIINEIEIEIGGQSIDKHYGEWLNIWADLAGQKDADLNKAIGNIPELYSYSSEKKEYVLYVPLQFWFCRASGLALPIMCLQYNDVKVNLELSDVSSCHTVSPTHYIQIQNDIVNFTQYEYISQVFNGYKAHGIFSHFDIITKRLYYVKISTNPLVAINDQNFETYTEDQKQALIDKYAIVGSISGYTASAYVNINPIAVISNAYSYNTFKNIRISKCLLLINYIFLDEDERTKFYKTKHEYLIDQLIYTGATSLDGANRYVKLGIINPCKLIVWTVQMNYLLNNNVNDLFNYTDSYAYNESGEQLGASITRSATILFNGRSRMATQDEIYYNCVQPMQYFKHAPKTGINIYSFCLMPDKVQPSGACNMSKVDNIQINLKLSDIVSVGDTAVFKCFGLTSNIFRIVSGIGGVVFTN
jgi:hypothetical protein